MLNRKVLSALGGLLAALPAFAYESSYNLPHGVTAVSREVHALHMTAFWVCVAIAVAVFGVMLYSIVAFRKSKGAVADQTMLHSTKVEIIWTVIPVLILVGLAVPSAKTLVRMEDTRNAEVSIKVTGYQWKWQYEYLGKGVSFYSTLDADSNYARQTGSGIDPNTVKDYLLNVDHPLVVPVDTKVRLLITASDVIHSWWVPRVGGKRDATPGRTQPFYFKADKEAVVTASGAVPAKDTYTVEAKLALKQLTGFRLEAIDDPDPKKGAGRSKDGNFVLKVLNGIPRLMMRQ